MKATSDRHSANFDESRNRIIDVAAELFAKNGYASTGVAELGEAVGLARGALYYYIKSKGAVLSAIHDRVLDPLLSDGEKIATLPIGAPARLTLMSESLLHMIVNYQDHVRVFLHEYQQLKGNSREVFRRKRGQFEDYVSRLIQEGTEAGDFDVEDVRTATLAWLNMHNYTYQWVRSAPNSTARALSKSYMEIILRGFAGTKSPYADIEDEVQAGRAALAAAG